MHKRISILLPLSGVLGASLVGCAQLRYRCAERTLHPAFWMIYQRLRRKSTCVGRPGKSSRAREGGDSLTTRPRRIT